MNNILILTLLGSALSVALPSLGFSAEPLVKPETLMTGQNLKFALIDTTKDERFKGLKLDGPIYFLEFPKIHSLIELPLSTELGLLKDLESVKVDYLQTKGMEFGKGEWIETGNIVIIRVRAGEIVVYDATICEVHDLKMRREALPTIYGMMSERDQETYFKDIETHPHGMDVAFKGCIVPDPPYEAVKRFVCPKCRKIYSRKMASLDVDAP
jgi:hypothetical protein